MTDCLIPCHLFVFFQFNPKQLYDIVNAKTATLDPTTSSKVILLVLKFLYLHANHLPGFSFQDEMF